MAVDALDLGDQSKAEEFAREFLEGERVVRADWLSDNRERPIAFAIDTDGTLTHLGVAHVSDFFLCLLQISNGTTTAKLVAAEQDLTNSCNPATCDICFTSTYSIDGRIRDALVRYWRTQPASLRGQAPPPR